LSVAQQKLVALEGEKKKLHTQLQEVVAYAEEEAKAVAASSKSVR
jgi:uncharacterized protein YjbJ (UPF0337 family)